MKTILTAAAIALISLPTSAQEATVFNDEFVGTKTRAEVRSEVIAALARGENLSYGEARIEPASTFTSTLTRAAVRAEVKAALARGERLSYGEARVAELQPRGGNAGPAPVATLAAASVQ